jgi:hypothetical protein
VQKLIEDVLLSDVATEIAMSASTKGASLLFRSIPLIGGLVGASIDGGACYQFAHYFQERVFG